MKIAILAGGLGSRLGEETRLVPKPMVEIGGRPILWHIMSHYGHYGYQEFVIALGYMGDVIKRYMMDYCSLNDNLPQNIRSGQVKLTFNSNPNWIVELIDTGIKTMTGGRLKQLQPLLEDQTFMLTWADGVSDVNIERLLAFHRSHGKLATLTAVRPPARFGQLKLNGNQITEFSEKSQNKETWVNGAFFVLEPGIFNYIPNEDSMWEREPLEKLAEDGQLMAYFHEGFWQCMDTKREKQILEELWESGKAPWKPYENNQ